MFRWNFVFLNLHPLPLITGHQWEEPGTVFFKLSLQIFIYIGKIPPEPAFLQVKQSQVSQILLLWEMLQSLNNHHDPSLDFLIES